jgi:hypothetical protein
MSMSDQDDWEFAGPDDAKAEIRAAAGYLLRGAIGGARGDIVQEIIAIVRQVAGGLPPEPPNSLDDGLPGGKVAAADTKRDRLLQAVMWRLSVRGVHGSTGLSHEEQ